MGRTWKPMSHHSRQQLKKMIELYMTTLCVDMRHLHYALKELYLENRIPRKAPSVKWLLAVYKHRYIAGKTRRLRREKYGKVALEVKTLVDRYSFTKQFKRLESRMRNEKQQSLKDDNDDENYEDCPMTVKVPYQSLVKSVLVEQNAKVELTWPEALYGTKESEISQVFKQLMPDFSTLEVAAITEKLITLRAQKNVTEEQIRDVVLDTYDVKETSDTETESGEDSDEGSDEESDEESG